jgi:hypothetical protein
MINIYGLWEFWDSACEDNHRMRKFPFFGNRVVCFYERDSSSLVSVNDEKRQRDFKNG